MKSLGFVEVVGVVAAIDALDLMLKTAGVRFVTWERNSVVAWSRSSSRARSRRCKPPWMLP